MAVGSRRDRGGKEMTLKEKAKEYNAAVFADDPDRIDDLKAAYQAGYKDALRWVHGFIYKIWKGDEKVLGVDVDVLKAQIEKKLGEEVSD